MRMGILKAIDFAIDVLCVYVVHVLLLAYGLYAKCVFFKCKPLTEILHASVFHA